MYSCYFYSCDHLTAVGLPRKSFRTGLLKVKINQNKIIVRPENVKYSFQLLFN